MGALAPIDLMSKPGVSGAGARWSAWARRISADHAAGSGGGVIKADRFQSVETPVDKPVEGLPQ